MINSSYIKSGSGSTTYGKLDVNVASAANRGYVVASGVGASRSAQTVGNISRALRLGRTIAGVYDELVLTIEANASNQDVSAAINGIMI
jgi:hypothetical protein